MEMEHYKVPIQELHALVTTDTTLHRTTAVSRASGSTVKSASKSQPTKIASKKTKMATVSAAFLENFYEIKFAVKITRFFLADYVSISQIISAILARNSALTAPAKNVSTHTTSLPAFVALLERSSIALMGVKPTLQALIAKNGIPMITVQHASQGTTFNYPT